MKDDPVAKGLTLSALRAFLTVAEKGGYWPASRGESGTAANLKNQVARLAGAFEVPLFQKHGRSIRMTARGEELQRVAADVLRQLSEFQRDCRDEKLLVRFGGGQAMVDELIVPRWQAIHQRLKHSRFQFHNLRTGETVAQLHEQRIDFGLVRKSAAIPERLESHAVKSMKYGLCVPRKLLKVTRGKVSLKHLPDSLPLAVVSGEGELRKGMDAFAESHGFRAEAVVECTSLAQASTFLLTETVAALLPESLMVGSPEIECFGGSEFSAFTREVMLVWNPERLRRMSALEAVKGELMRLLQSSPVGMTNNE